MDFLVYQIRLFSTEDAGHGGFSYIILWCFFLVFFLHLCSLVFCSFYYCGNNNPSQAFFKKWMIILFWTVLILFPPL